jgi:hypothetical protein
MSFYATIQGEIKYAKQEDFDAAVNLLEKNDYLKGDFITDECGDVISDQYSPDIDRKNLSINIPYALHRNLARFLENDKLFKGGTGEVVWTSTDGVFSAGVITKTSENDYHEEATELTTWGRKFVDANVPDFEKDFDDFCVWQSAVESAFFDNMFN